MKDTIRRTLCFGIAVIMTCPILSSCGKKPQAADEVISADSPWYDCTSVMVDEAYTDFDHEFSQTRVLGVTGDKIITATSTSERQIPGTSDYHEDMYLHYYDLNGNLTDVIDLNAKYNEYTENAGQGRSDVFVSLFELDLKDNIITANGFSTAIHQSVVFSYDVDQKQVVSQEEKGEDLSASAWGEYKEFDGYRIRMTYLEWNYYFEVESPDGTVTLVGMSEQIPDFNSVTGCEYYYYLGDGKVIAFVYKTDLSVEKVLVDLPGTAVSSLYGDSSYDWLDDYSDEQFAYFDGVGNIIVDEYGIYKLDAQTHETERILTYDQCNVNRDDMRSMAISYMDDQTVIFWGIVMRGGYLPSDPTETYSLELAKCEMIILRKAESNPNAGKSVIRAAYMNNSMSYATAEAIRLFNEQSEDAVILSDMRYTREALADQLSFDPEDTEEVRSRKLNAAFITALTIDLLAGEGPDIIFGTIDNTQLDDPGLLLDLKDCISRDECFMNILDSAMTGDALYQVPLCFSIDGILTKTENTPSNGVGFTYDEYRDLISGPCNGEEPTGLPQVEFMNLCIENMSDRFYGGGRYDFDCESFRSLAEFASDLTYKDPDEEFDIYDALDTSVPKASYIRVCSARSLLWNIHAPIEDYAILGIASEDGRGPLANVRDSVAIAASTSQPDACLRFVSMLTDREFQQLYAHNCAFPVNRDAFTEEARQIVQETNDHFDSYYSLYYYASSLDDMRVPSVRLDEDASVNTLLSYVDSISGIGFMDSPVQIIVLEEIQAYFAGQKTLDEVIGIINNRVDTYVQERAN